MGGGEEAPMPLIESNTARHRTGNCRGFTYIEAILTMSALLISVLGMAMLFATVNRSAMNGQMTSIGMGLCEQKMEEIVSDKASQGYAYINSANYPAVENLTGTYVGFTRTVQIYEVDAADMTTPQFGSGYKRIDVAVQWGPSPTDAVTLSSLVAN